MTTVGVTMVRDEADIIVPTLRNMLRQVDGIIVADNNSADETRELAESFGERVWVIEDPEVGYYQSRKMTALARFARERFGAEWIVPFDADEIWSAKFHDRIADCLAELGPQWLTASAELYNYFTTGKDRDSSNPVKRMVWRQAEPAPLPKVAVRWREDLRIHQGNHGASYHGGTTTFTNHLVVRHYPYRSEEQFIRKARNGAEAYAATTLPPSEGGHWRGYGEMLERGGEAAAIQHYLTWFHREDPEGTLEFQGHRLPPMVFDPADVG